ncbi:MAG TPA: FkbM family methyltransferase [Blastocatellia bacterium]|nr:FkbM family methyltransferase [Blastocatellia bacterium]
MINTIKLPRPLTWLQPFDFPHKLGICERIFGKGMASRGTGWVRTSAGIAWKLDLTNPTHRWIVYGKYEGSHFLNWARKTLRRDAIIVDSGANIGQMLLYLAQWSPEGKVFAFEPGKAQADWLEECLQAHTRLPVEIIRRGLGGAPCQLRLRNAGPANVHGAWNQISASEGECIQVVRLADELSARSVDEVDLWKLDVEGYEVPALQGAEEYLDQHRFKALYVELAGDNGRRVRDYLVSFGYHCHLFDVRGRLRAAADIPEHTNGLFLPA